MSKKPYWVGDSAKVWVAKAVVSPTGHVVAKNTDHHELRAGDLLLTLRLDRGELPKEGMTPEQRTAAQGAAREMASDFLGALGVEQEATGFKPGMVVKVQEGDCFEWGLVERFTDHGFMLRVLKSDGRDRLKFIPFSWASVEEVPDRLGMEGLLMHLIGCYESDDEMLGVARAMLEKLAGREANSHKID